MHVTKASTSPINLDCTLCIPNLKGMSQLCLRLSVFPYHLNKSGEKSRYCYALRSEYRDLWQVPPCY